MNERLLASMKASEELQEFRRARLCRSKRRMPVQWNGRVNRMETDLVKQR
jgi:hypothetical protein